jgi:dihydrofolate reductase
MRKLIVSMNITLDGFLSGPHCEMDWHFRHWSPDMGDALCSELYKADTVLMGRVTYNVFSRFANPTLQFAATGRDNFPFFDMLNRYHKIVFSKTLEAPAWQHSTICRTPVKGTITKLKKQEGKNIMLYGSARLLPAIQAANLVDEYQLYIHPVLLGKGKRMFKKKNESLILKTKEITTFSSGVVLMHVKM